MHGDTVLVSHRNTVFRHGVQHALGHLGMATSLDRGADADAVVERATAADIGVVVVDADMPAAGAIAVLCAMAQLPEPKPVVLVMDPGEDGPFPWGMFQGAVASSDDGRQLLAAVTAAQAGGTYLDPTLTRRLARSSSNISLTPRERQVLALTAEGASTRAMAERLHISTDTAKTHITNTMRKLGVDSRAAAIAVAYRDGLLVSSEQFRLESHGDHLHGHGQLLVNDFAETGRQTLRYLHHVTGLGLWTITHRDGGRRIALQSHDAYSDVKPGLALRWSDTLCTAMVEGTGPRLAEDVSHCPVYSDRAAKVGMDVGAYVGAPIAHADGTVFGTVCAVDPRRRMPGELAHVLPIVEQLALLLGRQSRSRAVSPIR